MRELHGVLPVIEALHTRMQELEQQIQIRMSPEQRNTIYRLVQAYGEARATRSAAKPGVALRKSWAEFNARFGIATYTDLGAASFDDAVQFVKAQYRTLTGSDLETGTQEQLL